MKKGAVAILIIIILSAGGAPLVSGILLEKSVRQSFDDINGTYSDAGSDVSVEINRYDRNYTSSQIEWKINLGVFRSLFGVDEIIFLDHSDHGFTNIVSTTSLEKNKWFMDFVENKLDGKNPLKITTEYNITGDMKSSITMDAFSFKNGMDIVEIKPGQMTINMDNGLKNVSAKTTWKGGSVPGELTVEHLSFSSQLKKISPYILDGNILFSAENIKGKDGKKPFEFTNSACEISLDFDETLNEVSLELGYGIDTILIGQENFKDAHAGIRLNRLDAGGYQELMTVYSAILNDMVKETAASMQNPESIKEEMKRQMVSNGLKFAGLLEKILKKGLEIRISEVGVSWPQGEVKGDIVLGLKRDMTLGLIFSLLAQPAAALDIFSLNSNITLPYYLVKDEHHLFSPFHPGMKTGLFIKEGDTSVHSAQTRGEKLFLNKEEVLLLN